MERLEFYTSKKKSILLLIASLIFVAIGIWVPTENGKEVLYKYLLIILFGFGTIVALLRIFRPKAELVLDSKGIILNPKHSEASLIAWEEIIEIKKRKQFRQATMITIFVKDAKAFIEREPSSMKRTAMRTDLKLIGTPFCIVTSAIDISPDKLLEKLNFYLEKHNS